MHHSRWYLRDIKESGVTILENCSRFVEQFYSQKAKQLVYLKLKTCVQYENRTNFEGTAYLGMTGIIVKIYIPQKVSTC